jgi:cytochrome c biogenesis protein CcmG/thiol:disulfide interchange protein DsbE
LGKGRTGWVKCPICGTKMKAEKLDGHKKRVHPGGAKTKEERQKVERRRRTLSGSAKASIVVVIIVVLILVIVFIVVPQLDLRGKDVGDKPYNFTLKDLDDTEFELDDHLGEGPVLMGFFSYTCTHCRQMGFIFQDLYVNYSGDLVIIGVHGGSKTGSGPPTKTDIREWALDVGAEYPVLFDKDRVIFDKYVDEFVPWLYLVDKDGKIVWAHEGAEDYGTVEAKILKVI